MTNRKKSGARWIKQLRDPNPDQAHRARLFIGGLQETDGDLLADLERGTHDADHYVRFWSAVGLKRLGSAARPAAARILDLLNDPIPALRSTAALALVDTQDSTTATSKLSLLARTDGDATVRHDAIRELGRVDGRQASDALEVLNELLNEGMMRRVSVITMKVLLGRTDFRPAPELAGKVRRHLEGLAKTSSSSDIQAQVRAVLGLIQ